MISRLLGLLGRRRNADTGDARADATASAAGGSAQELVKQGQAAYEGDDFDAAERLFRAAVAADPRSADAHMNLGNALNAKGRVVVAIESYERAVALDPEHASAHYNLGLALLDSGDIERVVRLFRTAVRLRDAFPQAWLGLGLAQEARGDFDAAIGSYGEALRVKPTYAEAHSNLGLLYKQRGRLGEAGESYDRALAIAPDDADIRLGLASLFQEQGEIDAAISAYQQALRLAPDHREGHGSMLFTLNYHPDMRAEDIFAAYRHYDERFGLPLRQAWRPLDNDRNAHRRLRVGYVSADFNHHPVRHFLEPLLAHHDKSLVEVCIYAELARDDAVTARYRRYADEWLQTSGVSDEALAERIRDDRIDILVDLAGHTAHNRLGLFARKPCPVSVSWLGYGYTTGLSAVDYYLTDATCVPASGDALFAEQPWRIATPGYVYRPAEGMGEGGPLPAARRRYVTFGTLTRSVRINHRSIRVWSEILRRVEGARLVIDSRNYLDADMRLTLTEKFVAHGIEPARLELGAHTPPWDVLRGMDIGLDCFPHNSGTTLFESLYMGVPFITLAGRPSVGRLGSSILHGIGHLEWIAHSEDEYIELAVKLASDLPRLARIRAGLRSEMEASPLRDEAGFARKVEAAYREMFSIWATAAP